jgi:hypothetical protein
MRGGLLLAAFALLLVLVGVAVPGQPSLETPWHGPDRHSSLPHPASPSVSMTVAAQPVQATAELTAMGSTDWSARDRFHVVARLEGSRLDHPPR